MKLVFQQRSIFRNYSGPYGVVLWIVGALLMAMTPSCSKDPDIQLDPNKPVASIKIDSNNSMLSGAPTVAVFVDNSYVGIAAGGQITTLKFNLAATGDNSVMFRSEAGEKGKDLMINPFQFHCGQDECVVIAISSQPMSGGRIDAKLEAKHSNLKPEDVRFVLDPERTAEKTTSELMRPLGRSEYTVTDSLKVTYTITKVSSWSVEAGVGAKIDNVWGDAEGFIKGKLGQETSTTYGREITLTRSVKVHGGTPYRLVRTKYFRTGKMIIKIDGKEVEVPFKYPDDFDVVPEEDVPGFSFPTR